MQVIIANPSALSQDLVDQLQAVLASLVFAAGVPRAYLGKVLAQVPAALTYNVDTQLMPQLQLLRTIGFSEPTLGHSVRNPRSSHPLPDWR
jgi:hypothetical protein